MMSKQSGDADGHRQQMTGGILQRSTAELSGVGICIPEQLAKTRSIPAPSATAAVSGAVVP